MEEVKRKVERESTHTHTVHDAGWVQVLKDVTFSLERGSRCLLVGANGSGKSTLLRVLSGKHIHQKESVKVLGCSAFFDTPDGLAYLGMEWKKSVGSLSVPLVADIRVESLIQSITDSTVPPGRVETLLHLLDIDLSWRMHKTSDGERKRVQILMGLLKPYELLLLDEVTTDLDVVVRHDLMEFLKQETEQRGATIVYATHIFDGLNDWPTHLLHLSQGRLVSLQRMDDIPELSEIRKNRTSDNSPLLLLVDHWLREDKKHRQKAKAQRQAPLVRKLAEKSDKYYNYWG